MNFSLIVPLYNEEGNIKRLLEKLPTDLENNKYINDFEVLCIDDGSKDKTSELLKKYKEELKLKKVRIIVLEKNLGQSGAIAAGIKLAKYEMLGIIDGDMQTDSEDFVKLLEKQQEADYDCVNGMRTKRKDPLMKRVSTRVARKFRGWIMKQGFYDITCPLKVVKKKCIDNLYFYNTFHRFIPYLVWMQGYKVAEIPVRHYPRIAGKSKYGLRNRFWSGIKSLNAVLWMKNNQTNYKIKEEC